MPSLVSALQRRQPSRQLPEQGPPGERRQGGQIVVCGTPEEVAAHPTSHTGRYLQQVLAQHPPQELAA